MLDKSIGFKTSLFEPTSLPAMSANSLKQQLRWVAKTLLHWGGDCRETFNRARLAEEYIRFSLG